MSAGAGAADLLVTGTDTGVGKTVVAAALVIALRARGVPALGFKPVETGVAAAEAADAAILAQAGGDEPLARPLLSLAEPLAPAVAAERAGLRVEPASVDERVAQLRARGYRLVVEGAGGARVPLAWGYDVLDLASRHGLEAVIVARAGLGTLNHVLLTVEALAARRVRLRGVVLNRPADPPDLAERTNPAALHRLLPDVALVELPGRPGADTLSAARLSAPLLFALL
jgi:dethiobiotin synthetase